MHFASDIRRLRPELLLPRRPAPRRSSCPISIALELFGDSWSLLVVRDLMFKGVDRFNGFLASGEGVASNILSDRLARLEENGLVSRRPDAADGRRVRYRLTRKGVELAPMLVELVLWSARHERTDAPKDVVAAMRRDPRAFADSVIAVWRAGEAGGGRAARRPPAAVIPPPRARRRAR